MNPGRVPRLAAFGLVVFVTVIVAAGLTLSARGRDEMQSSDAAFHQGDLRASISHARKAALAYVPGSPHVAAAHARLEAIARGAEAQGDEHLARLAWEALRVVHEQTDYPGRPRSVSHAKALSNLERLFNAREHDRARE